MIHFLLCILYMCLPLIVILYIFVFVISLVNLIKKHEKRYIIIVFISIIIFIVVGQSEFIKSRKIVNVKWMYGKTIGEVQQRYSKPPNDYAECMTKKDGYVLATREIYKWNIYEGMQGQYMYYVLLDENGFIADVDVQNLEGLPHKYMDRW